MRSPFVFITIALLACLPLLAQDRDSAGQDVKQAGQEAGQAVEKGAEQTGEAMKRSTEQTAEDVKGEHNADATDRLQRASTVLNEIMATPDKAIPQEVLDGAKCVAVVPDMFKAGFVFGGRHGKGVATCRTASGWSAPSFFTLTGGSWGAQIGAQSTDLVLMVMNDAGMKNMLKNKVELGADASVAAGPVGRHAQAGTDWKLDTQILSYSRSKGVFAGITLEGTVMRPDEDSTRAIYGKDLGPSQTLTGQVPAPAVAQQFLRTVANAKAVAEAKR